MPRELFDVEAERRALALVISEGQVLGAKKAFDMFNAMALQSGDFSTASAQAVFAALSDTLARQLAPIRSVLLPKLLAREGAKPEHFDAYLDSKEVITEAQAQTLARVLRNFAARRRAVEACRRIEALAETGELDEYELASEMQREAALVPGLTSGHVTHQRISERSDSRVRAVQDGRLHPTVASGYPALDKLTGGFQPTLGVICGLPGRAKSAFVASVLRNMAKRGESACLFSMEDRAEWLTFRWISHECGVPNFVLKYKPLTENQWGAYGQASDAVKSWTTIWVDDRPSLKPNEVLYGAREAFAQLNCRAVFIDNMTAMRMPRGDRRDLEFQDFLTQARALAEEFDKPFVVVSHTKLPASGKLDDMPRLIDCHESTSFDKLSRFAYGVVKRGEEVVVGVLKNNSGKAGDEIAFLFNGTSALLADPEQKPVQMEVAI